LAQADTVYTPCRSPFLPGLFCCPASFAFFDPTPCCAGFALLHREQTPHPLRRHIAPHCRLPSQRYTSHKLAHAHNSPAHAHSAHFCALYTSNGLQHGDAFPLVNGLFLTSLRPQMCHFFFLSASHKLSQSCGCWLLTDSDRVPLGRSYRVCGPHCSLCPNFNPTVLIFLSSFRTKKNINLAGFEFFDAIH